MNPRSSPQIIVPADILAQIIAHAQEGWPEEVCGLLSGQAGVVTGLLRARNISEDRRHSYQVDPQTLLRQFEFEEAGETLAAIYHSHPDTAAYPSASDVRQATYPDAIYIICSLQSRAAPALRAFRLRPPPLHPPPGAGGEQGEIVEYRIASAP